MPPMAFFTPQKGTNTGVKGRLEGGAKMVVFRNYIDVFTG